MRRTAAALAAWIIATIPASAAEEPAWRATDGDSLRHGRSAHRLYGIDAPELRQTCRRGQEDWPCGEAARDRLAALIEGRAIACETLEQDRYGRSVSICRADGTDLAALLVREGLAVAYLRYSWRYLPDEAYARIRRRGVWSGEFELPEQFRARHR
ncbi:thermonuclease family protein [Ferrovibrio sp.]|uniref:thermonuclease family protein n=1 Tax=Ferrovibrio sp. TaxID=1917215 RepID=UPI003D11DA84